MYTYTWYQWLTFFYLYCFFGWIFESTYVSLKQKRFVNRGFLRLPMLPGRGKSGSRSEARSGTKPAGPYSTRPGTFLKPGLNRRTGEKPSRSPRFTAKWG